MPDLLLELFSEEIPARMQRRAAADLARLVTTALKASALTWSGYRALATPRRIALNVTGLPARQPDVTEDRKGPRVGAPAAAIQGFLNAAGLTDIAQAAIQGDPKKGNFYVAALSKPGKQTDVLLAEILPAQLHNFPWPKSMRWGEASVSPSSQRWVRPLHSIVATFGSGVSYEIIKFKFAGVESGDATAGHRFLAPGAIAVTGFDDYISKLAAAKVIADTDERMKAIRESAGALAKQHGFELIGDEQLLEEVAGLVEWPVVLMGGFDRRFLEVPPEVIRATIRANQKCFVASKGGKLAPVFFATANTETIDSGATVIAGNSRVIRARLSDALYFWNTDQKPLPDFAAPELVMKPLDQRLAKLRALNIVFHDKLGTQGQRIERLAALAKDIADLTGADAAQCIRAAELCKADLVTEMVGEFPEVQGLMGRRYAELQGENPDVAAAIEEHYRPQGPADRVPSNKVSVTLALADKFDSLVGFWAAGEKPTGSKDPYALRRAALGLIRVIVENRLRLPLNDVFRKTLRLYRNQHGESFGAGFDAAELMAFLFERMKVMLREQGARHDLVDAVLSGNADNGDDLFLVTKRVAALTSFLATDDGNNLLAGLRRAANILRAEEKKDGTVFEAAADAALFREPQETDFAASLAAAEPIASRATAGTDFEAAMLALAGLRSKVDAFFEKILVNAAEPAIRSNRLRLLSQFRRVSMTVADFSKVTN